MGSNVLTGIFSGLGRGIVDSLRDRRQRSAALEMENENYQRRRNRALMEDEENFARTQARKIQEAERLKSLALQDALETELANSALQGGTMDATNMFMQNIPGAPTVSDIGMAAQNKALQASDIKTQTEMARRDYWKNRALQAANPQSNKKTHSTANNKELMAQIKLKEKELEDAKESYERIKSDIMTGVSDDKKILESEKRRLARIQNEYRSMLSGGPSGSSVTQQQKDEFNALIEKLNNLSGSVALKTASSGDSFDKLEPKQAIGNKALASKNQNKALGKQPATVDKAPTFLLAGGSMPAGTNIQKKKESLPGAAELKSKALVKSNSPKNRALMKTDDKPFKFSTLTNAITQQLNRKLSEDELGYIASGIYDGHFDDLILNFNEGTFTKAGAPSKRPLKDLIDSSIGDYAAENTFQFIPDARSSFANLLRGIVLTDKGVNALSQ